MTHPQSLGPEDGRGEQEAAVTLRSAAGKAGEGQLWEGGAGSGCRGSPGRGGRGAECRVRATHSPNIVRGCSTFSLWQISPHQLQGLSGDSVSSRGSPEGWGLFPPAWGHGQGLLQGPLPRGPKEAGQGALWGWEGVSPAHPLVRVGPRWVPGTMRPQVRVAPAGCLVLGGGWRGHRQGEGVL